jgi:retron-type reverse transcriptase
MLLEPIYEEDFYDFSSGFRHGWSAYDALESLDEGLWRMGGGLVIDMNSQSVFDTLDHGEFRALLRQRVVDGVIVTTIPVDATAHADASTSTCEPVIRGAGCVNRACPDL